MSRVLSVSLVAFITLTIWEIVYSTEFRENSSHLQDEIGMTIGLSSEWIKDYRAKWHGEGTAEQVSRDAWEAKSGGNRTALYFGYLGKILLVVNNSLYTSIADSLQMYREDLEREGYSVEIHKWISGHQFAFRDFLIARKSGLVGVVLIGELPDPVVMIRYASLIEWKPWCDSTYPQAYLVNDAPYVDLDGTWYDKDSDSIWDSCDPRTPIQPDIWLGRIAAYNLDSLGTESQILNKYFSKNHQFRLGNFLRPPSSLTFINFGSSECPFYETDSLLGLIYPDRTCIGDADGVLNSKADYLEELSSSEYELTFIVAHGGCVDSLTGHTFDASDECVNCFEIMNANPTQIFTHNYSCSMTDWTRRNCLSNFYVHASSSGLAAWGVTISGPWVGNTFYGMLASGKTIGEAMKVEVSSMFNPNQQNCYWGCPSGEAYLDSCPFLFFPAIAVLGDPTLRPLKKTWYVNAAGTGDAPTIQAAIDSAAAYDRIELAPGTYTGTGNRNIDFYGKAITVSAQNDSQAVVIDCQGSGRGYHFHNNEGSNSKLVGVTIINASVNGNGAGILCESGASPQIVRCFVRQSTATGNGGAIAVLDSTEALIQECTFALNSASNGGGVYLASTSTAKLERCLVAFNSSGGGVYYNGTDSTLVSCSDVYSNTSSNYPGSYSFASVNQNISSNPKFCDTTNGNYTLDNTTPCRPTKNSCGVWIGANRIDCYTVCGDCDGNGYVNISDYYIISNYVNQTGPAPEPLKVADVNCDGYVTVSDQVYLINYLFWSGPPPCDPDRNGTPNCTW